MYKSNLGSLKSENEKKNWNFKCEKYGKLKFPIVKLLPDLNIIFIYTGLNDHIFQMFFFFQIHKLNLYLIKVCRNKIKYRFRDKKFNY